MAMGLPITAGWLVMIGYHIAVTGSWRTSPYQLYTDIYAPRHVYGFDNVTRGLQRTSPKVIEAYDRWAQNLTPHLALLNLRDRWLSSWLWTFDLLPLLLSSVIAVTMARRVDRRWIAVLLSIVSLHWVHIPYWYTGIMGWHYVFESAPLWCLVLGLATDRLVETWRVERRWLMPIWWSLVLAISLAGDYVPNVWPNSTFKLRPRIVNGIASIEYPRHMYGDFDRWLATNVTVLPALVLIEVDPDDQHVDYIVNAPQLDAPILRGRFRPNVTDLRVVSQAFPDRTIYVCRPKAKTLSRIQN